MKSLMTFHHIDCGENTCATKPGKFCKYFVHDPVEYECYLFKCALKERDGWIMRTKMCLAAEKCYSMFEE